MHLVLVGNKSAEKIKSVIAQNFDNASILVYKDVSSLINETQARTIIIDRIILVQDGLPSEDKELISNIETFNDYITSWFPASKVITISKDMLVVKRLVSIMTSPFMVHLFIEAVKPRMLIDIVSDSVEVIRKKYGSEVINNTSNIIAEVINPELLQEESKADQDLKVEKKGKEKKDKNKQNKKKGASQDINAKEKKGFFGRLFGGRNKKPQQPQLNTETQPNDKVFAIGQGEGVAEFTVKEKQSITVDNPTTIDTDVFDSAKQEEMLVDYSIFNTGEESVDFGVGDSFAEHTNTEIESEKEDVLNTDFAQTLDADRVFDFSSFDDADSFAPNTDTLYDLTETPDTHKDLEEFPADSDFVQDTTLLEATPEVYDYFDKPIQQTGLGLFGVEPVSEDLNTPVIATNVDASLQKLKDIQLSINDLNIDTDLSEFDTFDTLHQIPSTEIEEVDAYTPLFSNLDDLEKEYKEYNTPIKDRVVEIEKVVEVEKVVEKVVEKIITVNSDEKAYKNGIRLIVVTGDRKSGLTKTALNLANIYSKKDKTLFVDFDIERRGSLLYLGLDNIVEEPEHIQNGLGHFRNHKVLPNVVYKSPDLDFDSLISLYDNELTNEHLTLAQGLIATQRTYKTVIIDCPLDKLYLLEDITIYAEVIICCESNKSSVLNTLSGLSKVTDNVKFLSLLFNHSNYLITKSANMQEFKDSLAYIVNVFVLDEETLNWGEIPILGLVKDLKQIAEGM